MFEQNTPPQPQSPNPLNPVMPGAGLPSQQMPPPMPTQPVTSAQPLVHTMPERFRTAGSAPGGPKSGSSTTKKLMITLVIVLVVAGLGVAGLFIFTKMVNKNTTNTANTNAAVALNTNSVATNGNGNVNTVTNSVLNTNSTDANTSTNLNTNTVSNDNTNTVSNDNTNAVVSNTNTSTNTNTSGTVTLQKSSADADSDGLTDVEEAVYGTDVHNPDTDGDTFIDGRQVRADGTEIGELVGLYNPKGTGTLEASGIVKRVENASKTYSLLVPTTWTTNESANVLVITPATQTGEFFQVHTYDNTSALTAQQWYVANNPQAQTSLLKSGTVNGLETLTSEDGLTVFFFKGTKVYGVNYTTGGLSLVNYLTTFEMMTKSFKLVAA